MLQRADELAATAGPARCVRPCARIRRDADRARPPTGCPALDRRQRQGRQSASAPSFLAAVRATTSQRTGADQWSPRTVSAAAPGMSSRSRALAKPGKRSTTAARPDRSVGSTDESRTVSAAAHRQRCAGQPGPFRRCARAKCPRRQLGGSSGSAVTALQRRASTTSGRCCGMRKRRCGPGRRSRPASAPRPCSIRWWRWLAVVSTTSRCAANEVASQFDQPTLDALLGQLCQPEGADHAARRRLHQGRATPSRRWWQLQPAEARGLQNAMAVACTRPLSCSIAASVAIWSGPTACCAPPRPSTGATPENQARLRYLRHPAALSRSGGRAQPAPAGWITQLLPAVHLGLGSYYDLTGDSRAALSRIVAYLAESRPAIRSFRWCVSGRCWAHLRGPR